MVQQFWNKLNANEKLASEGAIVIIISWIVGLISAFGYGGGAGILGLLCALGVLGVYWVKYSPTPTMTLPAPAPTVALILAGIVAITAILSILFVLPFLGVLFAFVGLGILGLLAFIAYIVGAVLMGLGTWREYQAMPKASTPPTTNS